MDDDPDLILMRGVAAGEPGAFETLRRRFRPYIRKIVAARIVGRNAADDVVQDVMVNLWSTAAKYDSARGSLSTWVALIVRRKVIDVLRNGASVERKGSTCLTENSTSARLVDRWIDDDERRGHAAKAVLAMSCLSPFERQAIELVCIRGLSFRQARQQLGVPMGTFKTQVRRGLRHLRMAIASPTYRPQRRTRKHQATPPPAPTSP